MYATGCDRVAVTQATTAAATAGEGGDEARLIFSRKARTAAALYELSK